MIGLHSSRRDIWEHIAAWQGRRTGDSVRVRTAGFEMRNAVEFWLLSLMAIMAAFFGIIHTYDS